MNDTLSEISKLVLSHPKVIWGIVQETHTLEEHVVAKVPGGAGATLKGQRYTSGYRCFLKTDAGHAERSGPDLPNVIRAVFEILKLEMPKL